MVERYRCRNLGIKKQAPKKSDKQEKKRKYRQRKKIGRLKKTLSDQEGNEA